MLLAIGQAPETREDGLVPARLDARAREGARLLHGAGPPGGRPRGRLVQMAPPGRDPVGSRSRRRLVGVGAGVAALLQAVTLAAAPAERAKVVLDTDIGGDIDDAWALGFILAHPGFDLVGVTISDGDTAGARQGGVQAAARRRTRRRARSPWDGPRRCRRTGWTTSSHGPRTSRPSARSPRRRPTSSSRPRKQPRADHPHRRRARSQNVADALRKEPSSPRFWKRVVLMSGCICGTAWSTRRRCPSGTSCRATADAQLVYAAGLPITIVPLDSTTSSSSRTRSARGSGRTHAPHDGAREPLPPLARRADARG